MLVILFPMSALVSVVVKEELVGESSKGVGRGRWCTSSHHKPTSTTFAHALSYPEQLEWHKKHGNHFWEVAS